MNLSENNEITVKIKCELNELYENLENQGFELVDKFTMDDTYMIPKDLNLEDLTTREILSKAILARYIHEMMPEKIKQKLTFKFKEFDEIGNILNQTDTTCNVSDIEEGKCFMNVIGYKEIMNIKESDIVYRKDNFQFAVKDIKNGDNLIEIEVERNKDFNTLEKIIVKLEECRIPIYTDNFFVKKAEIQLNKVLGRK